MSLTSQELDRLSQLCAIPLSNEEKHTFLGQLDAIIDFMNQLDRVKVTDIPTIEDCFLQPQTSPVFTDNGSILDNVKHRLQQGGIVVKSAVHEE